MEINKKLANKEYSQVESLQADFELMCSNAREYNQEGSIVYDDALELQVTSFDYS